MFLSVIVPVYNAEKQLNACIDSILNQDYKDFELILVDDGSTDKSGEICDEYAKKHAFIKVVHQKNSGVTSARKKGFLLAEGKYVSFIDSDDYIESNMYTTMLELVADKEIDIVSCNIVEELYKKRVLSNSIGSGFYNRAMLYSEVYPRFIYDFSICAPGVVPSLGNKIIKKKLLEDVVKNTSEAVTFGEDAIWSFGAIIEAQSLYVIDKAFYHYRNKKEFTAKKYDADAFRKIVLLSEELEKQLVSERCGKQIYGYITNYVLEAIRGELLYNKKLSFRDRLKSVKRELENERIQLSLKESIPQIKNQKLKLKLYFAKKKMLWALYVPFWLNSLRRD